MRAPLDSTANDPITRSPNYHHKTGKIENLSRENLCLAHGPLEIDEDDLDSLNPVLLNASARDLKGYVDALPSLVAR